MACDGSPVAMFPTLIPIWDKTNEKFHIFELYPRPFDVHFKQDLL